MSARKTNQSPLGKPAQYPAAYDPTLLYAMPRDRLWRKKGYKQAPYTGVDIWNAYEISWLNDQGLPRVAVGEFQIPCDSANLVESKSLKLYLCSLNQQKFADSQQVQETIHTDLSACVGSEVTVKLNQVDRTQPGFHQFDGHCLDTMPVEIKTYIPDPELLQIINKKEIQEKLYSHLLKSNCPVTGQPDWGSLYIEYTGPGIDHAGLLKYVISYRQYSGFHEKCIETIFLDLLQRCSPTELVVYARYLRRGGLDINPYRSTNKHKVENIRLYRQ